MIKLRAGEAILLGLSEGNLRLLKQGRPILIQGEDVGLPGVRIAIMYGETEAAIVAEIRSHGIQIPTDDQGRVINVRDGKLEH